MAEEGGGVSGASEIDEEALGIYVRYGIEAIAGAASTAELDDVVARYLGPTSPLLSWRKALGALPATDRPAAGQRLNEARERA